MQRIRKWFQSRHCETITFGSTSLVINLTPSLRWHRHSGVPTPCNHQIAGAPVVFGRDLKADVLSQIAKHRQLCRASPVFEADPCIVTPIRRLSLPLSKPVRDQTIHATITQTLVLPDTRYLTSSQPSVESRILEGRRGTSVAALCL